MQFFVVNFSSEQESTHFLYASIDFKERIFHVFSPPPSNTFKKKKFSGNGFSQKRIKKWVVLFCFAFFFQFFQMPVVVFASISTNAHKSDEKKTNISPKLFYNCIFFLFCSFFASLWLRLLLLLLISDYSVIVSFRRSFGGYWNSRILVCHIQSASQMNCWREQKQNLMSSRWRKEQKKSMQREMKTEMGKNSFFRGLWIDRGAAQSVCCQCESNKRKVLRTWSF